MHASASKPAKLELNVLVEELHAVLTAHLVASRTEQLLK